ncbi:MAG: EamA family transporter [Bacteroidetes bacterium]|nr:MAG: EamA family transporter [Bacteroidota bacterium]
MFKEYLQMQIIVLTWGFTALVGKLVTIPAVELVFYRSLFAFVAFFIICYFQKENLNIGFKNILRFMGNGFLVGAHFLLFYGAVEVSTVSICLIGMATSSLWASIFEPLIRKRPVKWYEILLGLIIILGIFVIFRNEKAGNNTFLGLFMALGSAFLGALVTIFNGKYVARFTSNVMMSFEMLASWLLVLIFMPFYAFFFAKDQSLHLLINFEDVFYILFLSIFCTVWTYSIAVNLMKKISAFAMNLSINMEPIYGIAMAAMIFGEHEQMTTDFYRGAVIILLAVLAYPFLKMYEDKRIKS